MAANPSHSNVDVRMRGFAHRSTVEQALHWLDAQLHTLDAEVVPLADAATRVLAEDVTSGVNVPGFDRAMMDGFALQAADTAGASPYHRLPLSVIGQSLPGRPFTGQVSRGQAVRIMTGAPMPAGADAVLPAEKTSVDSSELDADPHDDLGHSDDQTARPNDRNDIQSDKPDESSAPTVTIEGEVPPGKHIGRIGEDVTAGAVLLRAGRVLRPQDIGVISSIGLGQISVVRRPRVRIVITGNELAPAGAAAQKFQTVDSNGPMLAALIARDGATPINPGVVPDDPDQILAALRDDADVTLVSGGSSVGAEDFVPTLLARHGQLAIHGVAMRPSSPVGMGVLDGRLVFLLPGNPVSCLCAYDFFAGRAIRALGGRSPDWPYRKTTARLGRKLVSQVGRVDYARLTLTDSTQAEDESQSSSTAAQGAGASQTVDPKFAGSAEHPTAQPVAVSGSSILTSTTRADGFVIIPANFEGYPDGATVEVFLYD